MSLPSFIGDFWSTFGDSSSLVEVECDDTAGGGSLAVNVLSTFGIPYSGNKGGNLQNLDIKGMAAMEVIKLSLLEELVDGALVEPIVAPNGEVEFVEIGTSSASFTPYYTIQTSTYVDDCRGVLVRGGQLLPTWNDIEWKPVWGDDSNKEVIDTTLMMTNCSKKDFSTHATIIFNDPHLNTSYEDGIDNLFDNIGPFDKLLGYVRYIHSPNSTKDTEILYNNSTVVPIKISEGSSDGGGPDIGTLYEKNFYDDSLGDLFDSQSCWDFTSADVVSAEGGLKIPIPSKFRFDTATGEKIDKFVKVESIMFVGIEISSMQTGMLAENTTSIDSPTSADIIAVINVDNRNERLFKLEEGNHYTISYKSSGSGEYKEPYVVFAKDARINDYNDYGKDTNYIIGSHSHIGTFRAGTMGTATIFPIAGNKGIMVHEVWAEVRLDTPSISVYDPEYDSAASTSKAIDIAHELEYLLAPIIVYEPPPPIAFNGSILDQSEAVPDTNPRTAQNFTDTQLEKAIDEMNGGGGMEISLPFITDEGKLASISSSLYSYMNNITGIDTTYVCGPNEEVSLGAVGPSGGIINSISYSYTDSGSYTISVNEGPAIIGSLSGGGPTGPAPKTSETFSANGQIIDQLGNGMFFKVRIDGLGERIAINMSDSHLRIGDVVNCSVHNNAVEV